MTLSSDQESIIKAVLENLFETIKAKYLGQFYRGPRIYFEIAHKANPMNTLSGIFEYTLHSIHPNPDVDHDMIRKMSNTAGNYIEAEKQRAMQRITSGISNAKPEDDVEKIVQEQIDKSKSYIGMLMATETKNTQARAEASGIQQIGAALGMPDPTVVKLGVIDDKICPACKKLWHMPDLATPRVYKLSELQDGYNTDQKNPVPTIGTTHPNCRHTMSIVPLGYGYIGGKYQFISPTYDVYQDQRNGISKHEEIVWYPEGVSTSVESFLAAHANDACVCHEDRSAHV